ncbi:MAG: restriction endonuclease [Actinomycetota bacterium]|nr:restriction endonuclease [Actinomycetota bacterium]
MVDKSGVLPVADDVGGVLAQGQLPGKNPILVPTPSLTPDEFEDFTERLLSAHRFCAEPLRRVTRVERWGRRGDKQDGIDFEGQFSDDATACWQCKRYDKLTVRNVRKAVQACTFTADEYYLVFSGEASRDVRVEIAKHPKWRLLDQRGLGRLLDDLPLHKRRDVLDATWGVQKRKLLLEVPGEDAFLSLTTFAADRQDPDTVPNDLAPRVGREAELAGLAAALDRSGDWPLVVLITGPGGRGKTRLLVEALTQFQQDNPSLPVICLSLGRDIDAAALAELPHTPAVIVVDDAHREPTAIASLLAYARTTNGTQLVFASRPTGTEPLRAEIVNARYAPSQVETVVVGELTKPQARALVASLTDGLNLTLAAREYFADQAVDSPYVAVVAANLIRRGELTAPLAVDASLRKQVLARYHELAFGDNDGGSPRRVLAVYAALGPVDDTDNNVRNAIANFCGLKTIDLLRLSERLHDRGVLVTRNGRTRVVSDVLADHILEGEAAVGQYDTRFTVELWEAFGRTHGEQLVIELAELDWRLTRQSKPSVFAPVWVTVREELHAADHESLYHTLDKLSGLTVTQPRLLIEALEDIRIRLDVTEAAGTNTANGSTEAAITDSQDAHDHAAEASQTEKEPPSESDLRVLFGLNPIGADDVRERLPALYGQCATHAPDLLETALDALWALRRYDPRPTHQYPEHAERVITDRLADFGRLPEASFPARIVARVDAWLTEPAGDRDVTTPMFALQPLLVKDGLRTVPETRYRLNFQPFLVSARWARPLRDEIRAILHRQASGTDLRRAGAAVALLGEALRPPRGKFGQSISNADVLTWESDDLATVEVLAEAAQATGSPVIRRWIRRQLSWTAEYARSLRVRHAALTLVTELDKRGDDLAELLLNAGHHKTPSRRGMALPTLDELEAAKLARNASQTELSTEQLQVMRRQRTQNRIAAEDAEQQVLVDRVTHQLTDSGDPAQIASTLDECLHEIRAVDCHHNPSPRWFLQHLAQARPDLTAGIVREVTRRPAGPLDEDLDLLLNVWAQVDQAAVLAWLTDLSEHRPEVRLAAANAFVNFTWISRSDTFADVHHQGTHDPDPAVRDRFLMGSHAQLKTRPADTVELLLTGGISPSAATRALQLTCGYNGIAWGRNLADSDAMAVLKLINHTGWQDYTVQQIAAGIARTHPTLVLGHLTAMHHAGHQLPAEVAGLTETFDEEAEALTQWLVNQVQQGQSADAAAISDLVMAAGLTSRQAEHLSAAIKSLDGNDLLGLVTLLGELAIWPLNQPNLAQRLTTRAREIGTDTANAVRKQIADAMRPRSWGSVNGVSEDLERARTNAAQCIANEDDPELKEDFQQALNWIEDQIAKELHEHQEQNYS